MEEQEKTLQKVTDIEALNDNIDAAVYAFSERWTPLPFFTEHCEVMDQRQLRDAMGLRATMDAGDPWPTAERLLLQLGYHWHWLGTSRVMYLQEKEDFAVVSDWEEVEEGDN